MHKLLLSILLLLSSEYLVLSLECYRSPIPYFLNYSITKDSVPSFDNNTLIDTSSQCIFTIISLRNPENSIIVFGYHSISNKMNNILNDSMLGSVQYEKEGEIFDI